ncbi:PD-(D/E)XK motif protein [Desulfobacterium sp. N47]
MNNPWDEINPPSKDVSARRIDHTHSLDLFWARDHFGRYLFVYEFSSEAESISNINLPDLVGIQTAYIPANGSINSNRLVLLLNEQSNWELFLSLCNDLVQATRQSKTSASAVQTILRRLTRWHEFLRKNRSELLTEEKIKGLIGELLFIRNYLIPTFGSGRAIQFWQGTEGLPQDFNINNSAIEVKCQSGATSPYVRISSAEQLCPQLPEMYLFVITLGKSTPETENAINLPGLISNIRDILQSDTSSHIERFNDLLHMIGYIDSDSYLDFTYILAGEKMFQVTEGFPRICNHDIHHGIVKLSYDISLSECEPFKNRPDWMVKIS